ncbi:MULTISPECIES: ABC transporter permease subunit [unclassified Bacillus (in: firmicutes)]|uniref:ABC transporter permease subunit n=1 Tax=unclassified Bacillus (in: firmicutes) TaxID=185979 RepID=UPI0008E7DC92|nr:MULTISPECIES: ABC transporter permease subunit [unclassified Bacillus (in: firmicutes)]SFB13778.1 ABC-type dipeptide/oligopeptide/nickel transport system, permease component [Bacillus sp. UNCCL13]SFQ89917.1 ABC-type dipeptide/oligopeptide/nickel transport system, permease component [Bacillus sp. cl95]
MNKNINLPLYVGSVFVALLIFLSIFGPTMAPHHLNDDFETSYVDGDIKTSPIKPFEEEGWILGTDRWGYDMLSLLLNGIRYTVLISLVVTILKMVIGSVIGLYLGTRKKQLSIITAFENTWSYVPLFLIVYFFLVPFWFGSEIEPIVLVVYFVIVTTIVSIPSIVSSVRQKSVEIGKTTYVESAKTLGANRHRIVWKHIFPQMKESLLIMFVLEIVYVITIMGQLALLEIFVGGTKWTMDPRMAFSITKEIAGLVGQARGNIYGNQYILLIPLTVLLFTTASFSLLANGLKNSFQTNYQRTPWIFTGQITNLLPSRENIGSKGKLSFLKGESLATIAVFLVFVFAGNYVYAVKDDNWGVPNGSKATYNLSVEMDKDGNFKGVSEIKAENKSSKKWDELVFYFIPNSFQRGHSFEGINGYSEVKINEVEVDGKKAEVELKNDTLKVKLKNGMNSGQSSKVKISYDFTVPEGGHRFSQYKEHYYLAQWYPMLATFQKGKWNKHDYMEGMETYHTDFSDFEVSYSVPKGYSVISTADEDPAYRENKGTLKAKNVREFFLAVVKDFAVRETESDGVKIRLFSREDHNKDGTQAIELAKKALSFYQKNIGEYPHKQLDIVLDCNLNMEYPGIVTVNPYIEQEQYFRYNIVHEIAHQYFYGVVASDPYQEGWIDEGIAELATDMYFYIGEGYGTYAALDVTRTRMSNAKELGLSRQYSNVPLDKNQHTAYLYSQPALEIFDLVNKKYMYVDTEPKKVMMGYLSDYYHLFQYKQVDTAQYVLFTRNYFDLTSGYFEEWLELE